MRRRSLLRWIEQAEARRIADTALLERTVIASFEYELRRKPTVQQPRLFWPLLRRLRSSRAANDIC
jgi:hypothetical protein